MEIATQEDSSNTSYVPVQNPEEGGSDSSSGTASINNDNDSHLLETQEPPISFSSQLQTFLFGLIAASPTLLLICLGAKPSIVSVCTYIGLLQLTMIPVQCEIESGVARWFIGFVLLFIMSAWKSGHLLAACDNMVIKAVLYAITALWECSNAVLILGGKDIVERYGINGRRGMILYSLAPCQVKFVRTNIELAGSRPGNGYRDCYSGQIGQRSIHITICLLGIVCIVQIMSYFEPIPAFVASFTLLELEFQALRASMAVVVLDIPSHLWQLIHNLVVILPIFASSPMHASRAKVILPYGWVYSSTSTRQFWSRWSRPATQLIRHLFYHPLGGRTRWYISIPIMFLLNASSHFDLSYALTGKRAEAYWIAIFGTLAVAAMLEVVGDKFFAIVNSDGNVSFPSWYWFTRVLMVHGSLRLALYIMLYRIHIGL